MVNGVCGDFDQIDTLMRGHPRSKALQDDDDTVTYTQARTSYKTPRDERQNLRLILHVPTHSASSISPPAHTHSGTQSGLVGRYGGGARPSLALFETINDLSSSVCRCSNCRRSSRVTVSGANSFPLVSLGDGVEIAPAEPCLCIDVDPGARAGVASSKGERGVEAEDTRGR
jgi:hypothetical protein